MVYERGMEQKPSPGPAQRIVGLTGGIAAGKSTVGRLLRELGAAVVDADEVARVVVAPGRPAYQELRQAFGDDILQPGAEDQGQLRPLDRARLAALAFNDPEARRRLNQITHPAIAAESARLINDLFAAGHTVVIYEATLIAENGLHRGLAGVIVVDLPEDEQLRRAIQRGLPEAQARARMAAQATRQERLAIATWVIDNRGSEADTRARVAALWDQLRAP